MDFVNYRNKKTQEFNKNTLALIESGTLRNCMSSSDKTFENVVHWPNTLVVLDLKGGLIKEFLQHGLDSLVYQNGGAFLQASGIRYLYHDSSHRLDGESVLLYTRPTSRPERFAKHNLIFDPSTPTGLDSYQVQRHLVGWCMGWNLCKCRF
jgi:hypothetical protein